jgi:hypothetical protein
LALALLLFSLEGLVLSVSRRSRSLLSASAALAGLLLSSAAVARPPAADIDVKDLIKKSVAANDSDWKALPDYSHQEHDVEGKLDSDGHLRNKQEKTYRVMMMDGSPYNQLIAMNGKPLAPERQKQEQARLKTERRKRAGESQNARSSRIEKYKKERAEEYLLMQQMVAAFHFRMAGEEKIDGHDCYVLDATPNPDYRPPVSKARVLMGMKGRLWIEKKSYHWVRVRAQVVKPVEFALFIAKVRPGTEFELNQTPVDGAIWLPSRFSQSVDASVLGVYEMRTHRDEYYSNYGRIVPVLASRTVASAGTE